MPRATATDPLPTYAPVVLAPRRNGWTADRQRRFLATLAETGRVALACAEVGLTARSAYRLRHHPQGKAFAQAWDTAVLCGTNRLLAIAIERATVGGVREVWRDDKLVSQTRAPSDSLLMFLLRNFAQHHFAPRGPFSRTSDRVAPAEAALLKRLDALEDADVPADPLANADLASPPLAPRTADDRPLDDDDDDHDYDDADRDHL